MWRLYQVQLVFIKVSVEVSPGSVGLLYIKVSVEVSPGSVGLYKG